MQNHSQAYLNRRRCVRSLRLLFPACVWALVFAQSSISFAQAIPEEAYGPYNVVVLPDGSGLTKPVALPSALDPRAVEFLGRFGIHAPEAPDALLDGRAKWTLTLWFRASDPVKSGEILIAGIGDSNAEDARFISICDNHLSLWLGRASSKPVIGDSALSSAEWHSAVAVSDGEKVVLYADGKRVASAQITQGSVAPRLDIAPQPKPKETKHHFGGQVANLKIYREALSPDQVAVVTSTKPDFSLPAYEEATQHWPVQTHGMAGQTELQDPSTLPRGKGGIQRPVAKLLRPADIHTDLTGANPWTIRGGWKLAVAPEVKASGDQISKPSFATGNWMVATVPGTVLTTMIDRGIYPDPDYGLNNLAIPESLAHQDYWYRVEFRAPAAARDKRLTLTFEGVNYAAEVWLNGKKLGGIKGAFIRGNFDVTSIVSATGENALAVRVSPPPHPGLAQEESIKAGPGENGGVQVLDGPTFSATEGWDWIPSIRDRNTGIWQEVILTASGPVEVGDLNVVTTLPKPDRSEADIEIEVPLSNSSTAPIEGDVTAIFDSVQVTKKVSLAPGENVVRLKPGEFSQLKVQNPKLWWPNGYGDPALHPLSVSFTVDGKLSSQQQINLVCAKSVMNFRSSIKQDICDA
jgi:Concanavalin A-like lectin/glucanases superfamily/Glycosyl hydrolases family 2, sugar binding domain/Glycosyl hydrolases family 2